MRRASQKYLVCEPTPDGVNFIANGGMKVTVLAAFDGDADTLRRLLAEGVSVDTRSASGFTPLHRVCFANTTTDDREACFKLLRDAGANLDATDRGGLTPLHGAAYKAHSLVPMLIEAGANVNAAGSSRITPLHDAAKFASVKIAIALLRAGAAINVHDFAGHSPLHYAVACDNRHVRAALLRAGADITRLSYTSDPYIRRVRAAGGFRAYMRVHRDQLMLNFAPKFPRLPPQMVRRILVFWLHAGCY